MKKLADRINVILCDDVREEVGNKFSLIGVYAAEVHLAKFPAILPKLNFVLLIIGTKRKVPRMNVLVTIPDSEPIRLSSLESNEQIVGQNLVFVVGISPFRVKSPGDAKFEIFLEGEDKPFLTYKFRIDKKTAENPTAPPESV